MTPEDTFFVDQERVRIKIRTLEMQADEYLKAGAVVPANATRTTAAVLRVLWEVEEP